MIEKAIFGAGCFWGVEAAFRAVEGVREAICGYSGGHTKNPTYHDVCTGQTGHAEVVQVEYDPLRVSYDALLDVFWNCHNPTTLNRQGPDIGYAVSLGNIFLYARAGSRGASFQREAGATRTLARTDCHRNLACQRFLPRRGVPPTLFRKARYFRTLSHLSAHRPAESDLKTNDRLRLIASARSRQKQQPEAIKSQPFRQRRGQPVADFGDPRFA